MRPLHCGIAKFMGYIVGIIKSIVKEISFDNPKFYYYNISMLRGRPPKEPSTTLRMSIFAFLSQKIRKNSFPRPRLLTIKMLPLGYVQLFYGRLQGGSKKTASNRNETSFDPLARV